MKIVFWIAILIGIYLLIAYYRGTSSVLTVFGQFVDQTILFLQGRKSDGTVSNYPTDSTV